MSDSVFTAVNDVAVLQALQKRYGSADFTQWKQARRKFWSYVEYPAAGTSELNFFGNAVGVGGATRELTNMPKSNSFAQNHFFLRAIETNYFLLNTSTRTVVAEPYSNPTRGANFGDDILFGFASAGYLNLNINARTWVELPRPFYYAPKVSGLDVSAVNGPHSIALNEGTPNTIGQYVGKAGYVEPYGGAENQYIVDPGVFIEAEQSFNLTISYPSGPIPTIYTEPSNTVLYVGVILDGTLFTPVS